MATLNIKGLPDRLYRKLQSRAKRERRSVAQEVTHILESVLTPPAPISLMKLKGLGKSTWKNVDAGDHVARERQWG